MTAENTWSVTGRGSSSDLGGIPTEVCKSLDFSSFNYHGTVIDLYHIYKFIFSSKCYNFFHEIYWIKETSC